MTKGKCVDYVENWDGIWYLFSFLCHYSSGFNKKKFKTIPEYSVNSDFVSKYPRPQRRKTEIATINKCFIIIKNIYSFFQSEDTIVSSYDIPELTCVD